MAAPDDVEREERDEAHRAIGRYVVAFSRLIHGMRRLVAQRLAPDADETDLAEIALAEAEAMAIKWVGTHSSLEAYREAEERCLAELRSEVDGADTRRVPTVR